ncbi:MAG: MerR family transcriptional regulator [Thermoleophilia bacterium]
MDAAAEGAEPRYQIGEVAERVGLSLRTVRYYEEMGLARPSARSPGGFRLYSDRDVERLCVLKGMKPLGLSLDEIRELMDALDATERPGELEGDERRGRAAQLARFEQQADAQVARLELHLEEARRLAGRIRARRAACDG